MAWLAFVAFLVVVAALTIVSARSGSPASGCCAPADPADDLRMRDDPRGHSAADTSRGTS